MLSLRLAPFAILLEVDLALHKLSILAGPVIDTTALGAAQLDELILRHNEGNYTQSERQSQQKLVLTPQTTDGVPGPKLTTGQGFHQGIDDEPCGKDDNEAYRNIAKHLL